MGAHRADAATGEALAMTRAVAGASWTDDIATRATEARVTLAGPASLWCAEWTTYTAACAVVEVNWTLRSDSTEK